MTYGDRIESQAASRDMMTPTTEGGMTRAKTPYPHTCATCGTVFLHGSSRRVYCSPACRAVANRARLRRRWQRGLVRGEAHPQAKLTAAQVREARAQYRGRAPGAPSIRDLAAQYGVGYSTMWDVLRGRHWTHVE